MKFVSNIFKSLKERIVSLRYYNSISNLPIEAWFKIHETGDLKLLVRNDAYFKITFFLAIIPLIYLSVWIAAGWVLIGLLLKDRPQGTWERIYNEYISKIGLNPEYMEYLEQTKRIALLQCEWIIEPSPINKANIFIEKAKLEEKAKAKRVAYSEIIAAISKAQGYRIDPKIVTVEEFYAYLNINKK